MKTVPGSPADYQVSFDVTNIGEFGGAAVPQLYVADPQASVPRPPKELKGFAKVFLKPGETRRVSIELNPRSFSSYDADAKQWRAHAGVFLILLGSSSEQIELSGEVNLLQEISSK